MWMQRVNLTDEEFEDCFCKSGWEEAQYTVLAFMHLVRYNLI